MRPSGEDVRRALDLSEPVRRSGWRNYHDSAKTSASPLSLAGGTRTRLTIDGLGARSDDTFAEALDYAPWASNTLMGEVEGETFILRLGMTVKTTTDMFSGITGLITALLTSVLKSSTEDENVLKIEIDFGTFSIEKTVAAPRKQGEIASVTEMFVLHTGPSVIDPGGTVHLTSKHNAEVYDVDLLVQRLFVPS